MLGEFLYQLSERDIQGALLVPYYDTVSEAQAATFFATELAPIPDQYALLLQGFNININPGANPVHSVNFGITPKQTTLFFPIWGATAPVVAVSVVQNYGAITPNLVIPPGAQIACQSWYGGAVNHNLTLTAYGLLIPRGNLGSV